MTWTQERIDELDAQYANVARELIRLGWKALDAGDWRTGGALNQAATVVALDVHPDHVEPAHFPTRGVTEADLRDVAAILIDTADEAFFRHAHDPWAIRCLIAADIVKSAIPAGAWSERHTVPGDQDEP